METRIRKSGLVVPVEKPNPPSQIDLQKQYDKLHAVCPECGGEGGAMETTCMGFIITSLEGHVDNNKCRCRCGWEGICHDLVEAGKIQ